MSNSAGGGDIDCWKRYAHTLDSYITISVQSKLQLFDITLDIPKSIQLCMRQEDHNGIIEIRTQRLMKTESAGNPPCLDKDKQQFPCVQLGGSDQHWPMANQSPSPSISLGVRTLELRETLIANWCLAGSTQCLYTTIFCPGAYGLPNGVLPFPMFGYSAVEERPWIDQTSMGV
ncbi:hypothetical protein LX32DRAFT_454972 [Colletotrichum zoysiae]|uniref:Uncharacterized protein n=1 Tax=Colletotrichum zoysiae TaxID=1216348 RepID=A0AAD9HDS2_9PEZI|nr:hypothetical protein LX32DRAFT_454972 [Colletotrichum zoysiae]